MYLILNGGFVDYSFLLAEVQKCNTVLKVTKFKCSCKIKNNHNMHGLPQQV